MDTERREKIKNVIVEITKALIRAVAYTEDVKIEHELILRINDVVREKKEEPEKK